MPKRKAARPLRALCLENVAANMQLLWAKDYAERSLDEHRFRYLLGPFNDLAGCLVRELIDFMGIKRRVTRPVLHLLLVPQLTELDLGRCSQLVTKDVAQMISSRCKNLSLLYLQRCSRIPSDALVDLIESLPSLKKLDLSDTQCNTQVLSAVGSTCRHLCELNISDCKRLSPDSLFHLAYDVTAGSFSCQGLQNSPCLKSLELFYLPFCLDEVFEKVLEPRGAALVRLRYLSLLQCQISISTIHLLLAADNQLNSLHLDKCPDIYRGDYDELLRKVSREGLDLHIQWQ
uniref:F-box/LRR-repeat protein 15-like leucin rich repeat domain-containing protein n=1 Tax=Laticauda laticaudata TaxID=8630 RepID=A0A8C5SFQ5_LATLA